MLHLELELKTCLLQKPSVREGKNAPCKLGGKPTQKPYATEGLSSAGHPRTVMIERPGYSGARFQWR